MLPAPAGRWPFPTLSPRVFPWMLGPLSRRFVRCSYPFLPPHHRPSPHCHQVGSSTAISRRLLSGRCFATAAIPLCSGLQVCSPYRSFPPLWTTSPGRPWLLRPSRTYVVTDGCIGYASPPNRAIEGAGTFTPLDSRPCRLLQQCPLPAFCCCERCSEPFSGRRTRGYQS